MVQDDEYVMIQAEDMDFDVDSYDDCDEELEVRLSPLPSVCSEGTSSKGYVPNDLEALIEDSVTASIVSLEGVEDSKETGEHDECAMDTEEAVMETEKAESSDDQVADNPKPSVIDGITDEMKDDITADVSPSPKDDDAENSEQLKLLAPGGGSRLSNKKRRKRVKMIKKAAAAAAAAAALAEMNKSSIPPTSPHRNVQQPRPKSRKASSKSKKQLSHATNLAVACATESLESYRHDHNLKVKKTTPNYVALL